AFKSQEAEDKGEASGVANISAPNYHEGRYILLLLKVLERKEEWKNFWVMILQQHQHQRGRRERSNIRMEEFVGNDDQQ
ncbi:hypothetical protein KI387_015351, partial [Taxus chinensis]